MNTVVNITEEKQQQHMQRTVLETDAGRELQKPPVLKESKKGLNINCKKTQFVVLSERNKLKLPSSCKSKKFK